MPSKSDIAVSVRGLSKSYTIAHEQEKHVTLAETLLARLKDPLRRSKTETFWALKDIEFDIKKGDVVGIIGRNGAGKSTLLKILSRITEPTTGKIELYGRVGSLLEVGTGFHPELTGRENIFLNGAILGMSKAEVRRQFDAIVDFAGVEQFLDTPVKRYSSGMYVRLGFGVSAHLSTEILLVDEVLAVGDNEFQKRCLGKMKTVAEGGRTVVVVSHDMRVMTAIAGSVILMQKGIIQSIDSPKSAIEQYLASGDNRTATIIFERPREIQSYSQRARFVSISHRHSENAPWIIPFGNPIQIDVEVESFEETPDLEIGPSIFTLSGAEIASSLSSHKIHRERWPKGRHVFSVTYRDLNLVPGQYVMNIGVRTGFGVEEYLKEACSFHIVGNEGSARLRAETFAGAMIPDVEYSVAEG